MVLIDKNNIISMNFTKNNLSEDINFINTFLENYLINKNKVVSTNYIYNLLNYHENNTETRVESFNSKVNDSILLNISLFVKKKRSELRISNKKNNFNLELLNNFISDYLEKILCLRNVFQTIDYNLSDEILNRNKLWGSSNIMKIAIKELSNKILCDNIVSNAIKNSIDEIDKNDVFNSVKNFTKNVMNFNDYYKPIYDWYYNILSETFYQNIINKENNYLKIVDNETQSSLIKFIDAKNYYYKILKLCRRLILNDKLITTRIINILSDRIIKIFEIVTKEKKINLLQNFIDNNRNIIKKLMIINKEIFYIFSPLLKNIDLSEPKDLVIFFKIYEILKTFYDLQSILQNKIISKINDNFDNISYQLMQYVNSLVKKQHIDQLNSVYSILFKIKNKDILFNLIIKNTILRLTNNYSLEFEKKIYNEIVNTHKLNDLSKANVLSKILYDYESSKEYLNNYNKHYNPDYTIDSIVTSYDNWNIADNIGNCNFKQSERLLDNPFNKYMKYYNKIFDNKRFLIWYPHLGSMKIELQLENSIELTLLPLQYLVLEFIIKQEMTSSKEEVLEYLNSFLNYKISFLENIMESLINSNLLINNNDSLIINFEYNSKKKLDLIDFFNNSNLDMKKKVIEKEIIKLAHDRIDIIATNINSLIKLNGDYTKKSLFDLLKTKINVFELDETIYDNTINYMIKNDYIKIIDEKVQKLIY